MHDCINNSKYRIFDNNACSADFVQGEAEPPPQGLNQAQFRLLLAAGEKGRAKRSWIVIAGLLKGQEEVAAHNNGDMVDDAVKIQQQGFPLEVEIGFHYFEEHLSDKGLARYQ